MTVASKNAVVNVRKGTSNDAATLGDLPLISIVCPVFNAERYLEQCIVSVLNQTYDGIELVLVDDGSTDDSWKICRSYESRMGAKKVVALRQSNQGVTHAREVGVHNSHGELMMFVDADDYYMRADAMALIADSYAKNPFDICFINAYHERFGKRAVEYPWSNGYVDIREVRAVAATFRSRTNEPCDLGYAVIKAFRRELFPFSGYDKSMKLFEDTVMTMALLDKAEVAYLINQKLYFYRNNSHSALSLNRMDERLRCCDLLFRYRDFYYQKWKLGDDSQSRLASGNQSIVLGYLYAMADIPFAERIDYLARFRSTSLCRDWLDGAKPHCRIDHAPALYCLQKGRIRLLARVISLHEGILGFLKKLLRP